MKAKQLKEHDPPIKAMVRIQDQIDSVLNDESFAKLPSDERLQIFNKLQHRFNELKDEDDLHERRNNGDERELSQVQHQQEQQRQQEHLRQQEQRLEEEQPKEVQEKSLFHIPRPIGINKRYQSKAEQLARYIFKDPNVLAVNDTNEIVVDGKPVTGSNVYDLMSDALSTSRSKVEGPRPAGFEEFITALKEINAPRILLVNPAYTKALTPHSKSSLAPESNISPLLESKSSPHSNASITNQKSSYPILRSRVLSLYKV